MKFVGRKTVVEYRYDSPEEAKLHEATMKADGWNVEAVGHLLIPNFRSYSRRHQEGAFL